VSLASNDALLDWMGRREGWWVSRLPLIISFDLIHINLQIFFLITNRNVVTHGTRRTGSHGDALVKEVREEGVVGGNP